jgi:hypothetical protein
MKDPLYRLACRLSVPQAVAFICLLPLLLGGLIAIVVGLVTGHWSLTLALVIGLALYGTFCLYLIVRVATWERNE